MNHEVDHLEVWEVVAAVVGEVVATPGVVVSQTVAGE